MTTAQLVIRRAERVLPRAVGALASIDQRLVLGLLVVAQWLAIAAIGATQQHNGWVFYQGGDQIWYYGLAWLAAHGVLGVAGVGFGWSFALLPVALVMGPNVAQALPLIVVLTVAILSPVALLCIYGIAVRIGGRLFGYWAAALWVAVPLLGIPFSNASYHERYTEITLPQTLGLTAMADYPTMVALLAAGYLTLRAIEGRSWMHAAGAGLGVGYAIGMKPSSAAFLIVPAVAFAVSRRFASLLPFALGLAPAVVALTLWKWRSLGELPAFTGAPAVRVAAGPDILFAPFDRYTHLLDWGQLDRNRLALREYFWSERVLEWLPVAGLVGLARRSWVLAATIGTWFAVYILFRGAYGGADLATASLLRLLMPAYPAFVLLIACVPLLVPGLPTRLARAVPPLPAARLGRRTLALAAVLFGLVPVALAAFLSPAGATANRVISFTIGPDVLQPVPVDASLGLTAEPNAVHGVELRWRRAAAGGAHVVYRIFRSAPGRPDLDCSGSDRSHGRCILTSVQVGATDQPVFDDTPPPGRVTYRIGVNVNWRDDPQSGDVVALSKGVVTRRP